MKCLDCKHVNIIEYGSNGFIGETVVRCKICNEITGEMEDCEDFMTVHKNNYKIGGVMMKREIVLNFNNILTELKEKELKLCFLKGNGSTMLIEDAKGNMYDVETYYHNTYLDNLIKHDAKVSFNLIEDNEDIANIKEFGKIEVWDAPKVHSFMKRQDLL